MGEIIRMIVVLSAICAAAGGLLAGVKQATAPLIEEQVLTYVQGPALSQIFQDVDNDPVADRKNFAVPGEDREVTVFPAMRGGRLAGVAFEVFGKGYGGDIGVMVGFDAADDGFAGIGITTMKETPGVGSRVAGHGFTSQFVGHPLGDVQLRKNGGDIDAVSGATISSTGTVAAVRHAVDIYRKLKPEIADAWPGGGA